jgi:hypothetical protein
MQCCRPVNHQTPSPIRCPAPKRPAETTKSRRKPRKSRGWGKFVIFFTNSPSTVSAGLWLSTSGGAGRPRIQPHPHDSQILRQPSARRGAPRSPSAAESGQSRRGCGGEVVSQKGRWSGAESGDALWRRQLGSETPFPPEGVCCGDTPAKGPECFLKPTSASIRIPRPFR